MHANAFALSALLLGAGVLGSTGAEAVMTHGNQTPQPAVSGKGEPSIHLAVGGKLGDKYMSGKAGGAKGIGTRKGTKEGK